MRLVAPVLVLVLVACAGPAATTGASRPVGGHEHAPARVSAAGASAASGASASSSTTAAAIAHPDFLESFAKTSRFRLGRPTAIRVSPAGDAVYFLRAKAREPVRDLWAYDVAKREERLLVTADKLLAGATEQLSVAEKARRERLRLTAKGIAGYELADDGTMLLVPLSDKLFLVDAKTGASRELVSKKGGYPQDARFSPDARAVSCVRDGEVYVLDLATGVERKLTSGASATVSNGTAEFVAQEEMDRMEGLWWSADGKSLVYQQTDVSPLETFHIPDPFDPAKAPDAFPYPRAGKKNAKLKLGIVSARGGATRWILWDVEKYPYVVNVRWPAKGPVTLTVQNRAQTSVLVQTVDPATGRTAPLFEETDAAWVNLDQEMPRWLPDGSGFLWTTERNGFTELELHGRDGKVLRSLTPQGFGFRSLVEVDAKGESALVLASPDPTVTQVHRLQLADGTTKALTTGTAVHGAYVGDGTSGVWVHETVDVERGTTHEVVSLADGAVMGTLTSVAEKPAFMPKLELVTVHGKERSYHASILRPLDFVAGKRYPVLLSVYAGPGVRLVSTGARWALIDQWYAEQGFIVVSIDGRGTPDRGREWERVIKGDLISVALADQVEALQALAVKHDELDLARVGIYGWSFGGYFTLMALMQRPDVFKAGVAGAPVVDWADYDTHYTERFLGLPSENPEAYRASNVLTYAARLERPLLLVHGTADDNVYFVHSLKLMDALLRAQKTARFLPLGGQTHMVADPEVSRLEHLETVRFFREQLR